jgi:hypothetical protein
MFAVRGSGRIAVIPVVVAAVLAAAVASPAWAGYQANGYDLGVVQSVSGLANSTATVQTNPLFGTSAVGTQITTTFSSSAYQTVDFARLYLDVYGGTPYHSAQLTASLNGQTLPALTIGGTGDMTGTGTPGDGNPSNRSPTTTCVYGSGYGYWEIAYTIPTSALKHDGTANTLTFTASDPLGTNFDGRQYGATLVTVYSDPTIQQTLDYQLFEGDGLMRQTAGTTPPGVAKNLSRSLTITGVNTANVTSAIYTAGYATGHSGQTDQVYFNGTALGPTAGLGNDIARNNNNTELHSFDVTNYLQGSDSVLYSIDQSVLGGTGESSLHADWALLEVMHPAPEPATLGFLVVGAVGLWLKKRSRRKNHAGPSA